MDTHLHESIMLQEGVDGAAPPRKATTALQLGQLGLERDDELARLLGAGEEEAFCGRAERMRASLQC